MKQEEKKPREFFVETEMQDPAINGGWKFHRAWPVWFEMLGAADIKTVRMIEHSAYEELKKELQNKDAVRLWNENEQLKAKLEKAKKALRFYATNDPSARATLKELGGVMTYVELLGANLLALYIIVLQVRIIRLSKRVENLELNSKVENLLNRILKHLKGEK